MTREALIKHWDVIQAFKEGKEIQIYSKIEERWVDYDSFDFRIDYEYRIKPEPTKRLPTIEEVEQWFLDNRIFRYSKNGAYTRISSFDKNDKITTMQIGSQGWISVEQFCESYTNYDGSSLYITE